MRNLLALITLCILPISSFGQCNQYVDTTITPIEYTLNLNSLQLLDSNLCIDPILVGDTTWIYTQFVATSNVIVIDYNTVNPVTNPCSNYMSQGWFVYNKNSCEVYTATPYGEWYQPYSIDSTLGVGWKHFDIGDNIGDTLIAARWFKNQDITQSCYIQPCMGLYAVGDYYLSILQPNWITRDYTDNFNVYPNPTNSDIIVDNLPMDQITVMALVEVSTGRYLDAGVKLDGSTKLIYSTSHLACGEYIFKFTNSEDGMVYTRKVLIQN